MPPSQHPSAWYRSTVDTSSSFDVPGKNAASASATSAAGAVCTHFFARANTSRNTRNSSLLRYARAQHKLLNATGGIAAPTDATISPAATGPCRCT
jgi:hypothetical protein